MSKLAKVLGGQSQTGFKLFKKGGAVHEDEAEDRTLIRRMLREEKAGKKCGGSVKKMKKGK